MILVSTSIPLKIEFEPFPLSLPSLDIPIQAYPQIVLFHQYQQTDDGFAQLLLSSFISTVQLNEAEEKAIN